MRPLMFGFNRRQLPLAIQVPGGRVEISREAHGTVVVRFLAEAGEVQVAPGAKDYVTSVRITHEEKGREP